MKPRSAATAPLEVDCVVRDYGPLRPDEWAIFCRVVAFAKWDGEWCAESAKAQAEAYANLSERAVYDIRALLCEIGMIEKRTVAGVHQFRPRRPESWVSPEQIPIIRARINAYRKAKNEAPENVAVLSMERKSVEAKHGMQGQQLSLISLSSVFDFAISAEMEAWAYEACPNVLDIQVPTQKFIRHLEDKARNGWDFSRVDLVEEWRTWMRRAQDFAIKGLQQGRRNVIGLHRQNLGQANTGGTGIGEPTVKVPRFSGRRG